MQTSEEVKAAIATVLSGRGQITMDGDLCCYHNDGMYCVDYIYSQETAETLNFTELEKNLLKSEEELVEYFEKPEEAAEFYLRVTGGRLLEVYPEHRKPRTDIKKRVAAIEAVALDKDSYF